MCLEPRLQCRKPMDTDGDLGYGDGTVVWKACEMQMVSPALHPCLEQASCWKRNYKWEPLSMPGTGQESEPTAADCQQRRSVFRSVFLTFSSKALQVRSRMHPLLVVDQRSLLPSGSAVLTYETWVLFRMISDQLWKFVEADVAKVTLNDCRTQDPSTDQYFELTASGLLKNWPNASNHDPGLYETGEPAAGGRCLMVIEPEDTEEGRFWSLRMGRERLVRVQKLGRTHQSRDLNHRRASQTRSGINKCARKRVSNSRMRVRLAHRARVS
ncbi:unnamed protein product [Symbiodinium microadriaticum]|nr:unnamed protein product [Symbiodinium microadriaticum]CAE7885519.1 unnamed protein product [Symbiodinium sp. KB8]